jgi:hypothetical protein
MASSNGIERRPHRIAEKVDFADPCSPDSTRTLYGPRLRPHKQCQVLFEFDQPIKITARIEQVVLAPLSQNV